MSEDIILHIVPHIILAFSGYYTFGILALGILNFGILAFGTLDFGILAASVSINLTKSVEK